MDEIRDLSFRYRDALQKRALQVERVTEHIMNSPYPVIVCAILTILPYRTTIGRCAIT